MASPLTPLVALSILGCRGMPKPAPLGPVPAVRSSVTSTDGGHIHIIWDRTMMESCPIAGQINIIVDGNTVHPTSVVFTGKDMDLTVQPIILHGQIITWAYVDTGACDLHEVGQPTHEPDNQTYPVTNHVPVPVPSGVTADNTHITADDTTHTADQG